MNQQERVRSLIEIAFVLHRPASGLAPFVETHVRNFARRPKRYREQFLRHCRTAFNRDGFLVIPRGISKVEKPVAIFNEDLGVSLPIEKNHTLRPTKLSRMPCLSSRRLFLHKLSTLERKLDHLNFSKEGAPMANPDHLEILKQGVEKWNQWRVEMDMEPELFRPDLSGADLPRADLQDADLRFADLSKANLRRAKLCRANLVWANLAGACLRHADLSETDLSKADLNDVILHRANLTDAYLSDCLLDRANLCHANLTEAKFHQASLTDAKLKNANLYNADLIDSYLINADLSGANLARADMVDTDFTNANLTGCQVFGASVWDVCLDGAIQKDLVVSGAMVGAPTITVDNIEIAQFLYLILNNSKIRGVINGITSKGVLILGRFGDSQRKEVLDKLREKLRELNYLPIMFDFDRPTDKDYTETIQTLAGMSMFVIADVTSPKSTPLELQSIVPNFKIPVIPIIDVSVDKREFAMLVDLRKSFPWVLDTRGYKSVDQLLNKIKAAIIDPALKKRLELRANKDTNPEMVLLDDLLNE